MKDDQIELQRCRDEDSVNEVCGILDEVSIAYRLSHTAEVFSLATIGTGSEPEVIVIVKRSDYSAARDAMESYYLQIELPEEHYLLSSSNEELVEILAADSSC